MTIEELKEALSTTDAKAMQDAIEALSTIDAKAMQDAIEALSTIDAKAMQDAIEAMKKFPEDSDVGKSLRELAAQVPPLKLPDSVYPIAPQALKVYTPPTTQELHAYESAGSLIRHLHHRIQQWRAEYPEDAQPVVLAILNNGTMINAHYLYEEGHNGITVIGTMPDSSVECMVLTHQANLQLFCYIEKVEEPEKRRTIGFRVDGEEFEG